MSGDIDHGSLPGANSPESDRHDDPMPRLPQFPVIQQQLIDARDRLDREVTRLTRMHTFNAHALRLENDLDFVPAVAEAIVDIFELEFGIVWMLDVAGNIRDPIGVLGVETDSGTLHEAGKYLAASMAARGAQCSVLSNGTLAELAPLLPVGQAICATCLDAEGKTLAMLLGGNTTYGTGFFEAVSRELGEIFGLHAQQVAALIGNRRGRAIIEQQMAVIHRAEHRLRMMCDNVPDMIWAKDLEKRYLFANKAICDQLLHAADPHEPVGRTDLYFARRERDDRPADRQWHTFGELCQDSDAVTLQRRGLSVFEEFGNVRGRFLCLEVHKTPFFDEHGAVIGTVGSARDITERKLAEEQMRQLNADLDATLRAIPDLLFELSEAGEYINVWARNPELLSAQQEKLLGHTVDEMLPPEAASMVMSALREAAKDGYSHGQIMRLGLPHGENWFELSTSVKASADASAGMRFIMLSRDITERKRSELALRESEERLRLALAAARQGWFDVDLQTGKVTVSPEYARLIGYEHADFKSDIKTWLDNVHPDDRGRLFEAFQACVANGGPGVMEYRRKTRSGDMIWIRSVGQIVEWGADGKAARMIGIHTDITEHRRNEEELGRYRDHLETLVAERTAALEQAHHRLGENQFALDRSGIGIHWVDPASGRFLYVNATACAMLGYSQEEMLARTVMDIEPNFTLEVFRHSASRVRQLGNMRIESVNRHRDGHLFPVEVSLYFEPPASGETEKVIAFVTDISGRKAAEQALLVAKDAAEAASRSKSAFLANMSHEIRTPMNAILGFTNLLQRQSPTAEQADKLAKVSTAAHHLLNILNEILDFSKIEAGRMTLEQTEFDLDDLVEGLRSLINDRILAKGIAFRVELGHLPRRLVGDATRLSQALLNYLGNAVKFTERGQITLRARTLAETDRDLLIRFEIQDTGIGIPQEKLGRLFEAFEQADPSTTRKYGGTGLGLAINKRLAQLMNGEVGADSVAGSGSTFWFSARLGKISQRPGDIPKPASDGPVTALQILRRDYHGKRILLAEDDPVNQSMAMELLNNLAGLEVDLANNGEQALTLAGQGSYDLILMDMQMPVLDGLAATRAIRTLPGHARTPILAMTANAFGEDRQRCLEAGMNDHIPKPVDPDLMFDTLLNWLQQAPGG